MLYAHQRLTFPEKIPHFLFILKGVGWHTLRHTFASHLVMADVNLRTIKELLGHSDIKTTMIYAHLAPEHLKGAVERLAFR